MPVSVTMPQLGESVTEGTVTRWLKREGETVTADEPLLEVSTDKVDTEIPSPASGTLARIAVQEDETVEVGVELAVIDDGTGTPPAARPSPLPRSRQPSSQLPCPRRHRLLPSLRPRPRQWLPRRPPHRRRLRRRPHHRRLLPRLPWRKPPRLMWPPARRPPLRHPLCHPRGTTVRGSPAAPT